MRFINSVHSFHGGLTRKRENCTAYYRKITREFLLVLPLNGEASCVNVLASGCDAVIGYDERLEQDMIAVPIGARVQRFATAASAA
jgi:hypothetical protein